MGGAYRKYIIEEQAKPINVSDIPDGDWVAAKKEVERLRTLISQVDSGVLEAYISRSINGSSENNLNILGSKSMVDAPRSDDICIPRQNSQNVATSFKIPLHPNSQETWETKVVNGGFLALEYDGDSDVVLAPPASGILKRQESLEVSRMHNLLSIIKAKIFERTRSLQVAFSEIDSDHSGYISREEFRDAMSRMGHPLTDEEFELVNKAYPHKEAAGEVDKGIGYLEFVSMVTGQLTYVPGTGENEDDEDALFRLVDDNIRDDFEDAFGTKDRWGNNDFFNVSANSKSEERIKLWGKYQEQELECQKRLQKILNKKIFDSYYCLKDAFDAADKDKSGFIEPNELADVLHDALGVDASQEEIDQLIKEFDANGDGKLAYSEFVKCLQHN